MKTTLFVFCFFCATAAFGQATACAGAISNEPVRVEFASHPARASYQGMGQEQNLFAQSLNVQAHGVLPLSEVKLPSMVTPLGDSARLLKEEHLTAKKAEVIWTN